MFFFYNVAAIVGKDALVFVNTKVRCPFHYKGTTKKIGRSFHHVLRFISTAPPACSDLQYKSSFSNSVNKSKKKKKKKKKKTRFVFVLTSLIFLKSNILEFDCTRFYYLFHCIIFWVK